MKQKSQKGLPPPKVSFPSSKKLRAFFSLAADIESGSRTSSEGAWRIEVFGKVIEGAIRPNKVFTPLIGLWANDNDQQRFYGT